MNHRLFVLCISVWSIVILSESTYVREHGNDREGRYLSLFKFVRISHQLCSPRNGRGMSFGNLTGSCYSRDDCLRVGGKVAGTCAQGYGVCCLVTQMGSPGNPVNITINGTHLLSPTDLKNGTICQYRFPRQRNVCQLRLDFVKFQSDQAGPGFQGGVNINGFCNADTLTFTGASNIGNLGPLCGNLTGQHVYLDYGSSNEIAAFLYTATALDSVRTQEWDIQVTSIKCDSTERAPPGCLQYFANQLGTVRSFNHNGMQQLNNQDYSVCVKTIPGMGRITWSSCGGEMDFVISGDPPIPAAGNIPPKFTPEMGDMCQNDWVMIFGSNKYCGDGFNSVTTTTQPFLLQVHFNQRELDDQDIDNAGFCLMYQQSP